MPERERAHLVVADARVHQHPSIVDVDDECLDPQQQRTVGCGVVRHEPVLGGDVDGRRRREEQLGREAGHLGLDH